MNDSFDELERDISRLPMPAVSESLDARVCDSIRHIRDNNAVKAPAFNRVSLASWRWTTIQALAAVLLCVISFSAGRYSNSRSNVQVEQSAHEPDRRNVAVVQSFVEPMAQASFERLIGNNIASETIWGPANGLSMDSPVKEEL